MKERRKNPRHPPGCLGVQPLLAILQHGQDADHRTHPKIKIGPCALRRLGTFARWPVDPHPRGQTGIGDAVTLRWHLLHHTAIPGHLATELRLSRDLYIGRSCPHRTKSPQPRDSPNPPPLHTRLLRGPRPGPSHEHDSPDVLPIPRTRLVRNLAQLHRGADRSGKANKPLQTPRLSFHVALHTHDLGGRRPRLADGADRDPTFAPDRLRPEERQVPVGENEHAVPRHARSDCRAVGTQHERFAYSPLAASSFREHGTSARGRAAHARLILDNFNSCGKRS